MEISKKDGEQKIKMYIEEMIDGAVSEDFLKEVCFFISRNNYEDIIEERYISKYCGYPLCNTLLTKIPKQKYQIRRDGVYDIEERKRFCNDSCFKSSKYLLSQISEVPIWLRTREDHPTTIDFLSHHSKTFCPGSLLIDKKIIRATDEKSQLKKESAPTLQQEGLAKLAMDLESATLKEGPSTKNIQKKVNSEKAEEKIQNLVKNFEELKLMKGKVEEHPDPSAFKSTTKASIAEKNANNKEETKQYKTPTSPLTSHQISSSSTAKENNELLCQDFSLTKVQEIEPSYTTMQLVGIRLHEWFTLLTLEYIMGGRKFYDMCKQHDITTEMLFPASHYDPDKMAFLRKNYFHLCSALEKQDEEEELEDKNLLDQELGENDGIVSQKEAASPLTEVSEVDKSEGSLCKNTLDSQILTNMTSDVNILPPKGDEMLKEKSKKPRKKKKKVTFMEPSKNKDGEENEDEPLMDRSLPYVDFCSQKDIRTDIVYKKVIENISKHFDTSMGFYPLHFSTDLVRIIRTFRLTAQNVTCKPAMWFILTTCLLKLVSLKHGAEHQPSISMLEEPRVIKLINDKLRHFNTNLNEVYGMLDRSLIALLPYSIPS